VQDGFFLVLKRIAQNSLIYKGIEIYNEFRKEAGRTNNEKNYLEN
jgi:hypothetical protein